MTMSDPVAASRTSLMGPEHGTKRRAMAASILSAVPHIRHTHHQSPRMDDFG
jgi:hypothetical protein